MSASSSSAWSVETGGWVNIPLTTEGQCSGCMTGMTPDNPLIPSLLSSLYFVLFMSQSLLSLPVFFYLRRRWNIYTTLLVKYFDIEANKDTKINVILQFKSDPPPDTVREIKTRSHMGLRCRSCLLLLQLLQGTAPKPILHIDHQLHHT